MINRPISVQITQQENLSNAKYYLKKTLKPFHLLTIAKTPKQKLKQSVNYHQLTKTETARRGQLDLTIKACNNRLIIDYLIIESICWECLIFFLFLFTNKIY